MSLWELNKESLRIDGCWLKMHVYRYKKYIHDASQNMWYKRIKCSYRFTHQVGMQQYSQPHIAV